MAPLPYKLLLSSALKSTNLTNASWCDTSRPLPLLCCYEFDKCRRGASQQFKLGAYDGAEPPAWAPHKLQTNIWLAVPRSAGGRRPGVENKINYPEVHLAGSWEAAARGEGLAEVFLEGYLY